MARQKRIEFTDDELRMIDAVLRQQVAQSTILRQAMPKISATAKLFEDVFVSSLKKVEAMMLARGIAFRSDVAS